MHSISVMNIFYLGDHILTQKQRKTLGIKSKIKLIFEHTKCHKAHNHHSHHSSTTLEIVRMESSTKIADCVYKYDLRQVFQGFSIFIIIFVLFCCCCCCCCHGFGMVNLWAKRMMRSWFSNSWVWWHLVYEYALKCESQKLMVKMVHFHPQNGSI